MSISVARYLRTGSLGPIEGNVANEDIITMLGPPEAEEQRPDQRTLLVYGSINIWFETTRLASYGIYLSETADLPPPLKWSDFVPSSRTTYDNLIEFVAKNHIVFEEIPRRIGQLAKTSGGVWVISHQILISLVHPNPETALGAGFVRDWLRNQT